MYKISQHAGGVKTGAIAYWPAGNVKRGSMNASPVHIADIMPKILELAKIPNPSNDSREPFPGI